VIGRRRLFVIIVAVLLGIVIYTGFITTPPGPRDVRAFDPDRTAAIEVGMWKAYYDQRRAALFFDLVTLTRETYRCPRSTAVRIAFHFARAASTFANIRTAYEQLLPDIEDGYRIARDWSGLTYDPDVIAKAELAWWIARRIPGKDSAEQVGGLIADLNAQFYGVSRDKVLEASILRARAGRLRDAGGPYANWPEIGRLLTESYRSLHKAVN
jgi:hypothetical protein